jgi:hypothetical protein
MYLSLNNTYLEAPSSTSSYDTVYLLIANVLLFYTLLNIASRQRQIIMSPELENIISQVKQLDSQKQHQLINCLSTQIKPLKQSNNP